MALSKKHQTLTLTPGNTFIQLRSLNKRWKNFVLFDKLTHTFPATYTHIIQGANGSGKSTLLKILCALKESKEEEVCFMIRGKKISHDKMYAYVSASGSWISLPRDITVAQCLHFTTRLRPLLPSYTCADIVEKAQLHKVMQQSIQHLSSGMYGRLQVFLALYMQSVFTFLDEPSTALDTEGMRLLQNSIAEVATKKTLFIASHQAEEYVTLPREKVQFFRL